MSCFRLNESTGRSILEYANDREYHSQIRNCFPVIQFYWNILFTLSAMLLNALLCVAIVRFPNPLIKISPMLLANSIVDFFYSFIGYNVIFTLFTGFIEISNPTILKLMNLLVVAVNMASMNVIVAQFIYRFLNEKPRGRRLYWFLSFCFLLGGFHFFAIIIGNSSDLSAEDIEDSLAILRHYGFTVQPFNINGRVLKLNQRATILQIAPSLFSIFEFLLIICYSISIRKILRQSAGMKIAATRKLNHSMDRTIFLMGVVPILSNVVPSILYPILIPRCQSNAILSLVLSTLVISATFLNALITLVFIRSYRIAIFRLVTFGYYDKPQTIRGTFVITTS
ncbi:hypothetical protein M3Y98_00743100 [Aphelenchoides besseyi]|nr:hypothetical protein M3Y98_00743100 [Aphelenchoides besseyi]